MGYKPPKRPTEKQWVCTSCQWHNDWVCILCRNCKRRKDEVLENVSVFIDNSYSRGNSSTHGRYGPRKDDDSGYSDSYKKRIRNPIYGRLHARVQTFTDGTPWG